MLFKADHNENLEYIVRRFFSIFNSLCVCVFREKTHSVHTQRPPSDMNHIAKLKSANRMLYLQITRYYNGYEMISLTMVVPG